MLQLCNEFGKYDILELKLKDYCLILELTLQPLVMEALNILLFVVEFAHLLNYYGNKCLHHSSQKLIESNKKSLHIFLGP